MLTSLKVRRLQIPGVEDLDPEVLVQHLAADGDAPQVGRVHVAVVVTAAAVVVVVVAAVGPAESRLLQRSLLCEKFHYFIRGEVINWNRAV